jgi:hypothetical protein
MTEDEIRQFVTDHLPGVRVLVASEADGAPEVAWGDSFIFHDPDGSGDQKMPFATIVTKDYPGFDEDSDLNRPGVFRLNISVGGERFHHLFGDRPVTAVPDDATVLDRLIPHPVYAPQHWVSVLNPGDATSDEVKALLTAAHARAAQRAGRRRSEGTSPA